jgi:hypothetical protein
MTPLKQLVFGKPRDPTAPGVFHKMSLVAFLAWVGLGADGLSSSSYGPDEAFRAIAGHEYLALHLALLTAATVGLISLAYSLLLEYFPSGGGYAVATKLLGAKAGVVSGSAHWWRYLLVHGAWLMLCMTILAITTFEKFTEGGWLTLVITTSLILLCLGIHRHYEGIRKQIRELDTIANGLGLNADYRHHLGTEVLQEGEELCGKILKEFPRAVFYLGKLVFAKEKLYYRVLHNDTAYALQRQLRFGGMQTVVLPIRIALG